MKKTLLIAAAALAAGVISSQAQVYSQNIVGYVNVPFVANQIQVVTPALDADGTGTNNTVSTVFTTPTAGDNVFVFNGAGYDILSYKSGRGVATPGWYNGATLDNTYSINPGVAVFYLPSANETNTQVGIVLQGTNLPNSYVSTTANGISLIGSIVPIAGGVTSGLGYTPTAGDNIFIFNGAGYDIYSYKSGRGVATPGWYNGATLQEPVIPVGSGFWLQTVNAGTTWSENFVAQ